MRIGNWSTRDKAVSLLCLAVFAFVIIALIQGKFSAVAMPPVAAIIALLYHAIWQSMVRGWEGILRLGLPAAGEQPQAD